MCTSATTPSPQPSSFESVNRPSFVTKSHFSIGGRVCARISLESSTHLPGSAYSLQLLILCANRHVSHHGPTTYAEPPIAIFYQAHILSQHARNRRYGNLDGYGHENQHHNSPMFSSPTTASRMSMPGMDMGGSSTCKSSVCIGPCSCCSINPIRSRAHPLTDVLELVYP